MKVSMFAMANNLKVFIVETNFWTLFQNIYLYNIPSYNNYNNPLL